MNQWPISRWMAGGLIALALVAGGCSSEDPAPADDFDRTAMLTEMADGIILPSYDRLATTTADLSSAVAAFTRSPDVASLRTAQQAWADAADAWQDARPFDFGPAEGLFGTLSEDIGTYPASVGKIETAIAGGDTSLAGFDRDARGLYGLDYLLFHHVDDTLLARFTREPVRGAYARRVAAAVDSLVQNVRTSWRTGYREEFISRNGTDPGSGTSLLFNNMVRCFEQLKNYSLGLPLGKIAGQSQPEPDKVEGHYSGRSIILLRRHYDAFFRIWEGVSLDRQSIPGFRSYLATVPGGDLLTISTLDQHARIRNAMLQLADSEVLSSVILDDPARVEAVHTECQKLTRFIKSDLSSLIGIAITYSSGDGD